MSKHIRDLTTLLLVSAGLLGCGRASRDTPQPPAAAKPVEPPPPAAAPASAAMQAAPAVKLAAGEKLAAMGNGVTVGANPVLWKTAAGPVELATIVNGDHAVLRAYTATQQIDLTPSIDATGDMTYVLAPRPSGTTFRFEARALVGRAEGAGALFAYRTFEVVWDAATQKPVVDQIWSCDETATKGGTCDPPAWAQDADAADAPAAPVAQKRPNVCKAMHPDDDHTLEDIDDLDGDGVKDALLQGIQGDDGPLACDRGDAICPHLVFVRRGDCGKRVGVIPAEWGLRGVAKNRTHGYADLLLEDFDGDKMTYVFDGAQYVEKKK